MSDNQMSVRDVERDIMNRPSERNTTNLDLKRMRMILDLLGNPQDSFRIIHITGTNGKTSTTEMTSEMLKACGYTAPAVGNIGNALSAAALDPVNDVLCVELSSFQLHFTYSLELDCAANHEHRRRTTWTGMAVWRTMPPTNPRCSMARNGSSPITRRMPG